LGENRYRRDVPAPFPPATNSLSIQSLEGAQVAIDPTAGAQAQLAPPQVAVKL
jgi:hypothetical protein